MVAMKKKTSIMLSARDKRLLELLAKKENRSHERIGVPHPATGRGAWAKN